MQRETKEIVTLSGKKVVVHSYLSAREMQAINSAVLGNEKTDIVDGGKVSLPISSGIVWERKVFDAAVVSLDGVIEAPVEKILDMSTEEYSDLKTKLYEILKINLKPAK